MFYILLSASSNNFNVPISGITVDFDITASPEIGTYFDTISIQNLAGNPPQLVVQLEVLPNPPKWNVNPEDFTQNMSVIANWKFDTDSENSISTDEADKISVWRGSEICGVANIQQNGDFHIAYIQVYGDNEDNGTPLEFRIWNADEGEEYDGHPSNNDTIFYNSYSILGTTASPEILDVNAEVDLARYIYFDSGWNGFSINAYQNNMDVENVLKNLKTVSDGDIIVNGNQFKKYSDSLGWFNAGQTNLEEIDNISGYMIYLQNAPDTLRYTGEKALSPQISLKNGWNWFAYPFAKNAGIDTTMSIDLNQSGGFVLKHSFPLNGVAESFAIYDLFTNTWNGALENFTPNGLYKIRVDHPNGSQISWQNPEGLKPSESQSAASVVLANPSDASTWNYKALSDENVMPIIAEILVDNMLMTDVLDKVAFFKNDTLKGLANIIYVPELNKHVISLLVGEIVDNYEIYFYDSSKGAIIQSVNNLGFTLNGMGTFVDPYKIFFEENGCFNILNIGFTGNPFMEDKTFEASQKIRVQGNWEIPTGRNIILSAPQVIIEGNINPQPGSTITVQSDGCN